GAARGRAPFDERGREGGVASRGPRSRRGDRSRARRVFRRGATGRPPARRVIEGFYEARYRRSSRTCYAFAMSDVAMRIPFRDGKAYDVRRTDDRTRFEVWLGKDHVGDFVLGDEEEDPVVSTLGSMPRTTILGIAREFVDRGGAPMGIL